MLAAVRVRGVPDTPKNQSDTLQTLNLHNKNNCVILPDDEKQAGMLNAAKDYIAYGEVDQDTVKALLEKRGSYSGDSLADNVDELGYDSLDELVEALENGETTIFKLRSQGVQVPFRLSPPSKGYKGSRRHYNQGGSLGQRDDMDELLRRMI